MHDDTSSDLERAEQEQIWAVWVWEEGGGGGGGRTL